MNFNIFTALLQEQSLYIIGPKRDPEWIRTDSISHLNVAFAYMAPGTYKIEMMEGISEEVFRQVTALKQTAPGLKIWMSLGGWTYSDNGTLVFPSHPDPIEA